MDYGVSIALLAKILKDFGLLATENDEESFYQESGYFREASYYSNLRPIS